MLKPFNRRHFSPCFGELYFPHSAVQKNGVQGVHEVFMNLQPVAVVRKGIRHQFDIIEMHAVKAGEFGHLNGRAHISKNQTLELNDWVGPLFDLSKQG